jgi:hypothetical protein
MYKLNFSFKFYEVIEDIIFCVRKIHYEFSSLYFIRYCIPTVNLFVKFLSYQNFGKKLRYILSSITYDVLYYIIKGDIKTELMREKTEITNHVKR